MDPDALVGMQGRISANVDSPPLRGVTELLENHGVSHTVRGLPDSDWGELFEPIDAIPQIRTTPTKPPLRIVVFGSFSIGRALCKSVFDIAQSGRIEPVGVATDDPLDPRARISKGARFWRHYSSDEQLRCKFLTIQQSLSAGVPVYTGAVKCDGFRKLLQQWNPDIILMSGFGQIVDEFVFGYPKLGMYNYHPSDLVQGHGAGPQPEEDVEARGAQTSKITVHRVDAGVDSGPVVAQSPPIRLVNAADDYPADRLHFFNKMADPIPALTRELVMALEKWNVVDQQVALDDLLARVPELNTEESAALSAPIDESRDPLI